MTKEEYEQLLKSDYWKGYSYSLIKERNFTCEDCGKSFPNERNKLQVHHLVYRDVNPWSYKPEEVIVLCEECHRKRHGLPVDSQPSEEVQQQRDLPSSETSYNLGPADNSWRWIKLLYAACGILLLLIFILRFRPQSKPDVPAMDSPVIESVATPAVESDSKPIATKRKEGENKPSAPAAQKVQATEGNSSVIKNDGQKSTSEILEEQIHASVVEQAKKAGVSTEGSTTEILERINHASVVEQAKKAGVSTEGSTLDILDRIQHARVVEHSN